MGSFDLIAAAANVVGVSPAGAAFGGRVPEPTGGNMITVVLLGGTAGSGFTISLLPVRGSGFPIISALVKVMVPSALNSRPSLNIRLPFGPG